MIFALLYYAVVDEVVYMTDYFSEKHKKLMGRRKDHIYNVKGNGLIRNNFLPDIHKKGDPQNIKDANGIYALLSRSFTYYGEAAPQIPGEVLKYLPKFRENLKVDEFNIGYGVITDYIKNTVISIGIFGKPHKPLIISKCGGCK